MKQIKNVVGQVSGDTLVKVIIPSSPFLGQEAMVPVSAIGGGGGGEGFTSVISDSLDVTENGTEVSIEGVGGSYIPTFDVTVGSAVVEPSRSIYSRSGDIVTASILFNITFGTLESQTVFRFTLPIPATFTRTSNCIGTVTYGQDLSKMTYFYVFADSATSSVEVGMGITPGSTKLQDVVVQIQYQISGK